MLRRDGVVVFARRSYWWMRLRMRGAMRPNEPAPGEVHYAPHRTSRGSRPGVLVSVVVVVFNAPEDTMRCLESLVRVKVERSFEVIVVDNASETPLADQLHSFAAANNNVFVFTMPSNLGFARGVNIGVAEASGEVVILLNSDTVVTDGWLDELAEALDNPLIGGVSPVTNSVGHGPQLDPESVSVGWADAEAYARAIKGRRRLVRVPFRLVFFCVAFRAGDLALLNGLDDGYALGNYEDDDLCLRLSLMGYELVVAEHVFVYHRGGATFAANSIDHTSCSARTATGS